MNKSKKVNSKCINACRRLLLIICGMILGINIYLINANSLVGNQLPMPFGYGAAVVLSGSMEPEFSQGDLIIVKETDSFEVNDIVVFQDNNSLVVHRIIEMGGVTVTTKGDANNVADEPINISAVKGKVLFWIPFVGRIVNFLKTPIGIICIIAVAIALIEIPRIREMRKDDETEKLKKEIEDLKKKINS